MEGWYYNTREEDWHDAVGPFNTRDAAIEAAAKDGVASFFTGWSQTYQPDATGMADRVLEQLTENAHEAAGEHSDAWSDMVSRLGNADLDKTIAEAVIAWIDKHGLGSHFFTVRNVRKHAAEEVKTEGG
jgi:hypothetical protein